MTALLGQVFTPAALADLTLALALDGMGPRDVLRVLDPSCGDGVFLARALAAGVTRPEGCDIDPKVRARASVYGRVDCVDFFDVPPPERPYDLVVGNPPYVRQELLGAARKERIAARLAADWPGCEFGGRADLALAFVARALRFVRPGGRVAFVLSAALFDAGYGKALHRLLDGRGRLLAVVASRRERWFAEAAVHTVIAVLERATVAAGARNEYSFRPALRNEYSFRDPAKPLAARLEVPLAEAARRVHGFRDLPSVATVRSVGPDDEWSALLRAPDAWFAVVAAAGAALTPLADLADVRRGVTSGANDFFYLDRAAAALTGVEPRFWVPLFKSSREASAIRIDPAQLERVAFVCPLAIADLPAGARQYIRRNEHLSSLPSLRVRPRWWSLPAAPARLFMTKAYSSRFVQPLADREVLADQRIYALTPRPGVPLELLAAALNGTLTALAIEARGRASLGDGALELSVDDAARLPVLDVRRLDASQRRRVLATFRKLAARRQGDVFAEAGRRDRAELDAALSGGLGEFATALADAVRERLTRSEHISTAVLAAPAATCKNKPRPDER